jgi:hypothetical protein
MNPTQVTAWIQVITLLADAGIGIEHRIMDLLHIGSPQLTDAEIQAAYDAILADDGVREAFARAASQGDDPPSPAPPGPVPPPPGPPVPPPPGPTPIPPMAKRKG